MTKNLIAVLGICAFFLVGCGGEPTPPENPAVESEPVDEVAPVERISVYAVNYPLAWMAERIAGDLGDVRFPAPADVDPAYWTPDAETILEYQQADLVLLNGAGYATWTANASLPSSRLVDTTAGVADRLIEVESKVTHTHGPTGEHSHTEKAITTWLDLDLARAQAGAVAEALLRARPEQAEQLGPAAEALDADLAALDSRMAAAAERLGDRPVLYSHPVYQYFQRRYNVNGLALHWEPEEFPDERSWRELDSVLSRHPAGIMIWEGEPAPATRERLAALGIDIVVLEPGGNRPTDGDFLELLQAGAAALEAITMEN